MIVSPTASVVINITRLVSYLRVNKWGPRKDMIMLSGKDDKVGAMNIFVIVKRDAWILLIHRYSESFIVIPCGVKLCGIYLMGINHVLSQ